MREKPHLSDGAEGAPHSSPYRWVMLALLWLLYVSFGVIDRSLAPLITPILADLNMSYSQMGFVLGCWQLTYIGAASMAGFLIDRWGIRRSLFFGAVVVSLSMGLRYFSLHRPRRCLHQEGQWVTFDHPSSTCYCRGL